MSQTKIQDGDNQLNDIPEVTSRNKKNEIYEAYQKVLQKLQKSGDVGESKKIEVKKKSQDKILEKASKVSPEDILSGIADLENDVSKWLRMVAKALSAEAQKFNEVQEAMKIEKERLEEIYEIRAQADTFAALVAAHKAKISEFEREEEQYRYELEMKRRREEADYEEKRTRKVKELEDRELKILEQEKEMIELRDLKGLFNEKLDEEVQAARQMATNEVRREEDFKAKLLAEKTAAEKQIAQSHIEALEKELLLKEKDIADLKKELEVANREVKDIAVKVIEGRSARQHQRIEGFVEEKQNAGVVDK